MKTNRYQVRQDLYENGEIHCMAFTCPLMHFEDETKSDRNMAGLAEDDVRKLSPSWVGAVEKWNKLYKLICTESKEVPIK